MVYKYGNGYGYHVDTGYKYNTGYKYSIREINLVPENYKSRGGRGI